MVTQQRISYHFALLLAGALAGLARTHTNAAAELNLEALPSWNGTGEIGARVGLQFPLTETLQLGGGVAYLPSSVVIVDLTPAVRIGNPAKLWAQLGAGPAYSSNNTIDTREEGSRIMFHVEAMVGWGPVYAGWTHYSNAYIKTPNQGANFFTVGIKLDL